MPGLMSAERVIPGEHVIVGRRRCTHVSVWLGKPSICRWLGGMPRQVIRSAMAGAASLRIAVVLGVAHGSWLVVWLNGHPSPMPMCRMMPAPAKLSAAVVIQLPGVAVVQCTLSAYAARARFSASAVTAVRARVRARPAAGRRSVVGQPSESMATMSTAVMTHPQAALMASGARRARSRSVS
jgi:hypothetical protein